MITDPSTWDLPAGEPEPEKISIISVTDALTLLIQVPILALIALCFTV